MGIHTEKSGGGSVTLRVTVQPNGASKIRVTGTGTHKYTVEPFWFLVRTVGSANLRLAAEAKAYTDAGYDDVGTCFSELARNVFPMAS